MSDFTLALCFFVPWAIIIEYHWKLRKFGSENSILYRLLYLFALMVSYLGFFMIIWGLIVILHHVGPSVFLK